MLEGSKSVDAHEAWVEVVSSIGQVGYDGRQHHANNPPKFSDPRLNRALQVVGGYKQVCLTPIDQQQWVQKRFLEAYDAATDSAARNEIKSIGRDEAKDLLQKLNIPQVGHG